MQFQSYAYGKNHYELDPDLKVLLRHYWPEYAQHERALAQFGEFAGRQEVRPDHEAIALEGVAVGRGDQPSEPAAAHRGDAVRQPDPGGMQAALVQPAAADDPVALEGFAPGDELRRPQRHHRGAA